MPVGVLHDLAVGVDPGGADAWSLQDALATGVTVGAPPDGFNQRGQDWGLPPWRPDRLPPSGTRRSATWSAIVAPPRRGHPRSTTSWGSSGSGGCRLMGRRADGSYVRYDADALLGVLALEAARAGAWSSGEDLGTVEPSVTTALSEHGVLGARSCGSSGRRGRTAGTPVRCRRRAGAGRRRPR